MKENSNAMWMMAVGLGVTGALVELNLMRVFISDWLQSRKDRRSNPRRIINSSRSLAFCASIALGTSLVTSVARAQQDQPTQPAATPPSRPHEKLPVETPPPESCSPLSVQLNFDWTSAYFYHGINQEDTGLIIQPAARLTYALYQEDDLKIDGFLGTWNSVHSRKTGATVGGDFASYWYESDLVGGVAFTKGKALLTASYTALTSPSDAYKTVQELDFTFAYDDSDLLHEFALHPYATLGWEISANGSDGGDSDPGQYLELGIAPGFTWTVSEKPIAISFPATVGLSLNDYYQNADGNDNTFGFACIGAKAAIPLDFNTKRKWTFNAGVLFMFFGDHTKDLNAGRREQVVGTIGLQLNY